MGSKGDVVRFSSILVFIFCVVTSPANAEVFDLIFFQRDDRSNPNLFTDFSFTTQCVVEISDAAIAPNAFVDVFDPAFKRFDCTIRGNDMSYSFTGGADIAQSDYWSGQTNPTYSFGLLFDGDGKPLRFDAPDFFVSTGFGIFDDPDDTPGFGDNDDTYLEFSVNDAFDTPAAVFLEEAEDVFGTLRPEGYITRLDFIAPGTQIALLNGNFRFFEQWWRDGPEGDDGPLGPRIPDPLELFGYYTFDEQLVTPKMRITQAVFDEKEPIKLVHERTTAILLDRGPLFSDRKVTFSITDKDGNVVFLKDKDGSDITEDKFMSLNGSLEKVFYCDSENGYCNLLAGNEYIFRIQLDDGNLFESRIPVSIVETTRLLFAALALTPSDCEVNCSSKFGTAAPLLTSSIDNVGKWFPVRTKDRIAKETFSKKSNNAKGAPKSSAMSSSFEDSNINKDASIAQAMLRRQFGGFSGTKKAVLAVGGDYFLHHGVDTPSMGFTTEGLVLPTHQNVIFVNQDIANRSTLGHEFFHSIGIAGHICDISCPKPTLNGVDIIDRIFVSDRIDLRDAGSFSANKIWISAEDWGTSLDILSDADTDPILLNTNLSLSQFGDVAFNFSILVEGFDGTNVPGTHVVEFLNGTGEVIDIENVDLSFQTVLSDGREISFEEASQNFSHPYETDIRRIQVRSAESSAVIFNDDSLNILFSGVADLLGALPSECVENHVFVGEEAKRLQSLFKFSLQSKLSSAHEENEALRGLTEMISEECELYPYFFDGTLSQIDLTLSSIRDGLLARGIDNLPRVAGDLDLDGDVDRDDLRILMASRNQPASGADDPKDLDSDGRITGLDARKLQQLCTRPRCATQ